MSLSSGNRSLTKKFVVPGYNADVETVSMIDVAAFNWNCPRHIKRRYAEEEIAAAFASGKEGRLPGFTAAHA